jgi:hypothetical protein
VYQDRLADPHAEPPDHRLVGRSSGERHGRSLFVRKRGRLLRHDVRLSDVILGVTPVRPGAEDLRRVIHLVADREILYSRPDLFDHARDVRAEDYRCLETGGAAVCPELRVYGVGARGYDPNLDLGCARVGFLDFPLLEEVRPSELWCDHGSHDLVAPLVEVLGSAILPYAKTSTVAWALPPTSASDLVRSDAFRWYARSSP